MAQPVFNQHPLDAYLQQAGELSEPMPGALPELLGTFDDDLLDAVEDVPLSLEDILEDLPPPLLELLHAILSSLSPSAAEEREFSERFKYDIISSSSLLAASISPPMSAAHSRSFSMEGTPGDTSSASTQPPSGRQSAVPHRSSVSPRIMLLSVCSLLSFLSGSLLFAVLFAIAVCYSHSHAHNSGRTVDRTRPTLNTLNELITAGDLWESTIHEAYALIENEENSLYHGRSPTALSSPSSKLRVALLSALQTTQSQCDNVRQLLSALTSPAALAQLSEMYAPPSPARPTLALGSELERPLTLPARQRELMNPPSPDKRSTWSGGGGYSYAALASAGSPSRRVLRRHEKRRSDLSALLEGTKQPSISAPATPDLAEEEEEHADAIYPPNALLDGDVPFGPAALDLQRDRLSAGISTLGFPTTSGATTPPLTSPRPNLRQSRSFGHSPRSAPFSPPSNSSSRFTSMQTTRHPLSLSSLNHSLTGALAAKRYAAAHLLALRFNEEEDEQYWDDVREVMALLTSALADAASRLSVALEEAEEHRLFEQNPTPASSRRSSAQILPTSHRQAPSFAPMPSHFARFATHVDAITTALSDARDNLESCVSALREESALPDHEASPRRPVAENPAVQAYERLRRELGLALRECERGRERLLDLVAPPANSESDSDSEEGEGVPALAHDASDESDKGVPLVPASPSTSPLLGGDAVLVHALPPPVSVRGLEELLAERLPPQGIEQVFEAEPEALTSFVRERSKVPRDERIKQARARREAAGLGLTLVDMETATTGRGLGGGVERWGPGGDVVDELKDVIWKVGERRRRMAEAARSASE